MNKRQPYSLQHASTLLGLNCALILVLIVLLMLLPACTPARSVTEDVESGVRKLELRSGDRIKVVTVKRERMLLEITHVGAKGLQGNTLDWQHSRVRPNMEVYVSYRDLALVQEEHFSSGKTAGAIASITLVGALVAAVAVGPEAVPLMVPP